MKTIEMIHLAQTLPSPHFTKASAAEALAHAHFLLVDYEKASEYKEKAIQLLEGLEENGSMTPKVGKYDAR